MTVNDFIGLKVTYDADGQMIFGETKDGGHQLLLDVRGWGTIKNLFGDGYGTMPKAEAFQDEVGQWFADAINEKLERDK